MMRRMENTPCDPTVSVYLSAAASNFAYGGPALHVVADQPIVGEGDLGHMRGPGKRRVGARPVALFVDEGAIAAMLRPERGRIGVRAPARVRDRILRIVVHLDQFGRVLRLRARIGDDEGDRIADMRNAIRADERDIVRRSPRAIRLLLHRRRLQRLEVAEISARQHEPNAWCLPRGLEVPNREARLGYGDRRT